MMNANNECDLGTSVSFPARGMCYSAVIHFVVFAVRIHIRMNGITPILILCAQFFVAFALHTNGILP